MKKSYLFLCFIYSLSIFSSISLDKKIDFILDSELGEELTNTIIENSMESLPFSGLSTEELDEVEKIVDPYLDNYIKDIKENVRILYKETFSEEEIDAYYNFLNSNPGKSFTSKMPQFSIDMMEIVFSTLAELLAQMEQDPYMNPLIADNLADIENNNSCLYCDLNFQSLRDRNLDGVNLSGSNLQSTDFTNSSLIGANFSDANLVDTNFTGSNLENSNFTNAVIESADFSNTAIQITDLEDASYICNVMLSSGIQDIDC